jgi:hypothetical protein
MMERAVGFLLEFEDPNSDTVIEKRIVYQMLQEDTQQERGFAWQLLG